MTDILDLPDRETRGFGHEFSYSSWLPNSVVTLANVPWNNDYRDVAGYRTHQGFNDYIDNLPTEKLTLPKMSYLKPDQPIRVPTPFNVVNRFNYLRASNPLQAFQVGKDVKKDFFYFIIGVRYVAPGTTELTLQLDVWATYAPDVKPGNCYIEMGHIGVANSRQMENYGRDYLTIPDGLDVGGEYRIIAKRREQIMSTFSDEGYDVLVASTVNLLANYGDVENPVLVTASGSTFNGLVAGAEYYVFSSAQSFRTFMTFMGDKPWVTQGIISITAIPKLNRYLSDVSYQPDGIPTPPPPLPGKTLTHSMFTDWRNSTEVLNVIPLRYRHLRKLFTYPYMIWEMTTWGGTPIILKPESWANDNATITERISMVPPNQRVVFSPQKYNANKDAVVEQRQINTGIPGAPLVPYGDADDSGEYLDLGTQISNFPSMALVNNGALSYMASNANSIAFQARSADWSQTRANGSSQTSYDQATSGMELSNELTKIGRQSDKASTDLANNMSTARAVVGGVASIAGGVGGGPAGIAAGVAGAAMGGVNAGLNQMENNASLGIRNQQANRSNSASVEQSGYLRDTNRTLAKWASKGDHQVAIAGINSKVQDAQLTQPTTSGQVGGEAMNLIHDNVEVSLRLKMVDNRAIKTIGEHWLRYGYPVRQFAQVPDSFQVMSNFTYWKLAETYLKVAPMPESHKQAIRGILEKGVTVYRNPDDIGTIDIGNNVPLAGVTLA